MMQTRKPRPKQKAVIFSLPPDLYRAAKAEIRSQGMTMRDWIVGQMQALIRGGPEWRGFLAEQSERPEAEERGKITT